MFLVVVSMAPPAFASTIIVNNTSDSGASVGSLRWAIQTAQPGDTIQFNLPNPSIISLSAAA
jgi:hypothetical protein